MIFVTTGTCDPFDRMLRAVAELRIDEPLVVQHGVSPVQPPAALCVDFLPFEDLVQLVRASRLVVTHAGVGSVLTCLMNGKRPIVVPRLASEGDAVDDHQLEFALRLEREDLVTVVEDLDTLERVIAAQAVEGRRVAPAPSLVSELRSLLLAAAA